jgi:hypothetical protein
MLTCRTVYRHICDNLDESLFSPRCRAIRKHLSECPGCSAYLATLKTTVLLYRHLPLPRRTAADRERARKTLEAVLNRSRTSPGGREPGRRRRGSDP